MRTQRKQKLQIQRWSQGLLFAVALLGFSKDSFASIRYPFERVVSRLQIDSVSSADFQEIARIYGLVGVHGTLNASGSGFKASAFIPMGMPATNRFEQVAGRIVAHTLGEWMKSEEFRSSTIGGQTQSIQKKLNVKVSLRQEGQVEHKIEFKVDAGRARAALRYEGHVRAEALYEASDRILSFELSQKLTNPALANARMILSQSFRPSESLSQVGIKFEF